MRKVLILFVVVVALALAWHFVAWERNPHDLTIVAFGDSLTYGTGSEKGGGFVKVLEEDLGRPIFNMGIPGDTTADALKRINTVIALKPDVTILLLGGNDYLDNVPREETAANLGKIIETLQAAGSKVLLLGIASGTADYKNQAFFNTLAVKYRLAYVPDVLQDVHGNQSLMSDALHPNDEGYALVAKRILPELRKLLY